MRTPGMFPQIGVLNIQRMILLLIDIHNFTKLCEVEPNHQYIAAFLNRFFERNTQMIDRDGGHVLKFIGDAILASFDRDKIQESLKCARDIKDAYHKGLDEFEAKSESFYTRLKDTNLFIGMSVGNVLEGRLGTINSYQDYSIWGPQVNALFKASKIKSEDKIWITEDLYRKLSPAERQKFDVERLKRFYFHKS